MTRNTNTDNPTGGDSLLIIMAAFIPLLGGAAIAFSVGLNLVAAFLLAVVGGGIATTVLPDATRAIVYLAWFAYNDLHPKRSTEDIQPF